ncbi:beta-ketoacyl-ACP synthase [Hyphomicrobium sp.]|uniref:beta-ketoacyl-ACP synthase n=1 Tax=Hyphomicrobium sp. TaxID=82 RepID=UPI0025BE9FDF|nr:beta-ketoacyl-ACP synthase [Hyphomicrobium sp.]MCC7251964.1 beta-ketoacyl-ACP synthase [Hyphomicrobium sp.]
MAHRNEVWITGVGLVSSLGADAREHAEKLFLSGSGVVPIIDETRYSPYPVHPLVPLDFSSQISRKSDQKQMELWQRIGVYAAGLALSDAGIAGDAALLDRTDLVVAAGSGERDTKVDCEVLERLGSREDAALLAKEVLPSALRPTLFLAQLSNMLAGNISIVHNVTGSSRTFMGEEMAGLAAIENAFRRIQAGQADRILVGGALNAEREDLLLGYEIGHNLWRGPHRLVWERCDEGGGFIPGSVGAFVVLEARAHAEDRSAKPYARIAAVETDRASRAPGQTVQALMQLFARLNAGSNPSGPLLALSGASGVEPASGEELVFLASLAVQNPEITVRAYGSLLGHSVEAHFPLGIALAALALEQGSAPPPFGQSDIERPFSGSVQHVLVTGVGHWRGEGLALLQAIE